MNIEHVALWSNDIEALRRFYTEHFGCRSSALYNNPTNGFSSYFLSFESGARLEVMQRPDVCSRVLKPQVGLAHFAVSTGSEANVTMRTEALRAAGVIILSEPRRTGDGYFEAVVSDPDGNRIELSV